MSESKISCPHCGQHIALDHAWAGKITLKAGGKFPVNLTGEFNAKVE